MAEEADKKQDEAQSPAAAPTRKRKAILVVATLLVCLGIGMPVGYFILKPAPEKTEENMVEKLAESDEPSVEHEQADEAKEVLEGEEALGAIVPFVTFLVNLSGGKYLRLQLQAEFETPDVPKRLYSRIVPIRDAIISLLTRQTALDLEDAQGKEKIKKSIREIMNEHLRREDVRRIYFTQFVIQ